MFFRNWQLNTIHWSELLAASFFALAISIGHSQGFRSEFQDPAWLILWYGVSLLTGLGAGLIGGFLLNVIPFRLATVVRALAGGVFGVLGYYLQVSLLLTTVFWINPGSF